jgi:hypothetical protein
METLFFEDPNYPGLEFWVTFTTDDKIRVEIHPTK